MPDRFPSKPDFAEVPRRVDRKAGAELVSRHFFPVAPRSLEDWPLTWLRVNGRALCEVSELFAVAQAKVDAAPPPRRRDRPSRSAAPGRAPAVGCAA